MRLSEVDDLCPREWVIGHLTDNPRMDTHHFSTVCMMDMGSSLHHWIQNSPVYFGERLLGYWRCLACNNIRRFGVRPTEPCEVCNALPAATQYEEWMCRMEKPYRVVMKLDAILRMSQNVYRFGDIKTTGKEVLAPAGKDVAQLVGYMFFYQFVPEEKKLPVPIDTSCGYLFYFTKIFNVRAPVKTFAVRPNQTLCNALQAKAEYFTIGVDEGILPPPINVCLGTAFTGTRARSCAQCSACSTLYNRGQTKIERGDNEFYRIGHQSDRDRVRDNTPESVYIPDVPDSVETP